MNEKETADQWRFWIIAPVGILIVLAFVIGGIAVWWS
jgi:hypothetical protein